MLRPDLEPMQPWERWEVTLTKDSAISPGAVMLMADEDSEGAIEAIMDAGGNCFINRVQIH